MRLTYSDSRLAAAGLAAAASGSLLAALDHPAAALFCALVASVLSVWLARRVSGSYSNLLVLFSFFGSLYGVSGPIGAMTGAEFPALFPRPYLVGVFLVHYNLAIIGLVLALVVVGGGAASRLTHHQLHLAAWDSRGVLFSCYFWALAAAAMQIVNLSRTGGIQLVFAGKSEYASAMSEMTGALPASVVLYLSACFLGIQSNRPRRRLEAALLYTSWLAISSPILLAWVVLGSRIEILSIALIFLFAAYYARPLRTVKSGLMMVALAAYIALAGLYATRGWIVHAYVTGDVSSLLETASDADIWIAALNPSSNEFNAPFLNFNTHVVMGLMSELRLGETYLNGFTLPIPRFIWPDKPVSVTYEFRDTYFLSEASRGFIAGTGFSSILEAYLNFRTAGVAMIYFIVALALGYIERKRERSRSLFFAVFYLTLVPAVVVFSRSGFGMPIFWPLLSATGAVGTYILFKRPTSQSWLRS